MKKGGKNWGFDTKTMDKKVRPQDDFYRYAHGTWLRTTKIPATESRWGNFTMLRVDTEKKLRKIVESLKKGRFPANSPEQMIRDFYLSGLNEAAREKLGVKPLLPLLARVEKLKHVKDITPMIAAFHRMGIGGLWGGLIDQDAKNSERYLLYFYQDGIGMPDRDYYLKDDAESKRVREAYLKHLHNLHMLVGLSKKETQESVDTIMRVETALAKASMTKEDARDSEKTWHKHTIAQLQRLAPAIDWELYMRMSGAPKERDVNVMQPEYLRAMSKMLETVPLADWKVYFRAHVIDDTAGLLSKKFVREQFNYYGKALAGTRKMKPLWRRALSATNGSLGELLGQIYVEKHFPPEAKIKMSALVDDLFAAYEKRIKSLDWMSEPTKKKAVQKLRMMNRKIGYPDKWKSYRGLTVRADDFFGNIMRSAEYEHKRQIKKLGRPIDRAEWLMDPQVVNAYCSFNMNEIVFPAAILQPPFFSLTADMAVNYGSIGSVIGHEITHGFDDQGSKFDGKGNMKSWWLAADKKHFDAKAKLIKQQYDAYTVADGVHVNGQLTLGENIADLGGMSIAFDAYQAYLARTGERDEIEGFTPEQRFFLGFSLFDMELMRPEAAKTRVLTDPHSPSEFRINGPIVNNDDFYKAFGVVKGDKLYRDPKKRARIW
ncbi:MAG TPA: M13 family metallopeptidase [Candidatus Paceibacterota bacterium]|nr:M13 family metallopeptidase [Candidatus Paceibacterota bacterium]